MLHYWMHAALSNTCMQSTIIAVRVYISLVTETILKKFLKNLRKEILLFQYVIRTETVILDNVLEVMEKFYKTKK